MLFVPVASSVKKEQIVSDTKVHAQHAPSLKALPAAAAPVKAIPVAAAAVVKVEPTATSLIQS